MPTRLLVADDDRGFCQQIAEAIASDPKLELLAIVHDGKSVLEVLHRETPDVLLLDLVMPELDGIGDPRGDSKGSSRVEGFSSCPCLAKKRSEPSAFPWS